MPYVTVDDIKLYYEAHGEGEPLLLIMGWGAGIDSFNTREIVASLAERYRVIAFDNRGMGRSGKPDTPYSIELLAADAIGLLDALGIERAHVLGTSMGSNIAQVIAAKYPGRVKGLVLHVGFTRPPTVGKLTMIAMSRMPGFKRNLVRRGEVIFSQKYPPTPESFLRQFRAGLGFDGRKLLPQIKAPTLIVNGTKDEFVPLKITRELEAGIAGARLLLLEGADHMFAVQNPELLIKPALEFLADVDAKMVTQEVVRQ